MTEPVHLDYIDTFREVLKSYHVSSHAQKVLDQSTLVVMTGLAGGGRNTVINVLVSKYNYFFLVSDTTRPPKLRNGVMEQNGIHYYFRSEADLLKDLQNGEFIEAELIHNQQVSGTSIRELQRANETGRIAIHDFEFGGANNVAAAKPDAFVIGLVPPSYEEWIKRLANREKMHEQEFFNRLQTAEKVLVNMLEKSYLKLVINDEVSACVDSIRAIVEKGAVDDDVQARRREIVGGILHKVRGKLRQQTN